MRNLKMNINNSGSQWKTLHPQADLSFSSGGVSGSFARPSRQITKSGQSLFQNFPPTNSNNGSMMSGFSNFGGNSSGLVSPRGAGPSMSAMDYFPSRPETSPFNRSNGSGSSNMPTFSPTSRNGFDQHRAGSNGFGTSGNSSGLSAFERSISNQFEPSATTNGFSRQMSMPSNLCNQGMSNGFSGRHMNGGSDNSFGLFGSRRDLRDTSPPLFGGASNSSSGPMSEMKIGTWDDGTSSANRSSNNSFPTVSTFEIGTFNAPTASNRNGSSEFNNGTSSNIFNSAANNSNLQGGGLGIRETGIIEKLLHSYGFIQCCDRQARLFFHFSQFDGNIEHLKIGDPVEFEMTYDRRTGKPIASSVSKIAPEVVMSEERVIGTVTTELRVDPETGQETQGRISYENRGECFFLPFTLQDVEGNVTLISGDKVSFQMATMQRSGTLVARAIRLENPAKPVRYQGVVNLIKEDNYGEKFGTIERSDVVREIMFLMSSVRDGEAVNFGDDVEFTIQTRNGKESAVDISKLPTGTVVFEDIGNEWFKGQVLKPLDRSTKYATDGEALNGRIKFRGEDRSEVEVQFGDKDQVGNFTLKHGDWVQFVIAIDRRDKLQRATKIQLLEESFQVSDERREQGIVQSLKEGFGFIKCADRDVRLFFHFSEFLDVVRNVNVGDECEFTVAQDPNQMSKLLATRIKYLKPGSVKFETVIHSDIRGRVDIEPIANAWPKSPLKGSSSSGSSGRLSDSEESTPPGKILYELNGVSLEIPLSANDCDIRKFPRKDDVVMFDISQLKATKETKAVNIRVVESKSVNEVPDRSKEKAHKGYIAAIKDGFGFIETMNHEKEIFFHFSNYGGKNPEKLEVGTEVEYFIFTREKGSKISAECVSILPKGTISPLPSKDEFLNGKVVRSLRSVNPDQDEYCGLIHVRSEEGIVLGEYKFGIASLLNKKELLQVGDPVQFQAHPNDQIAVNIQATNEKLRSVVEAMKGLFGFLSYEVDEGKKLFFHTSEVEAGETLQQGDEVEFVVVTNKRTGKHSACCIKKLSSSQRPERLKSKLKSMNLEDAARGGRKITVVRQPKGPDGTEGFNLERKVDH